MALADFLTRDPRTQREKDRQLDSLKFRHHAQVLHIADLNDEVALLAVKGDSALREAGVVPAHVRPSRYEGFVAAAIPDASPAPRVPLWAYIARWEDINLTSTKRGIVRYQAAVVRNSDIIKSLGEDIKKRQWELERLATFEADWERRRLDWQRKACAARFPPRPVLPLSPSLCLPRPVVGQRHRVRFVGDVVDNADSSVAADTLAVGRDVVATTTAPTANVDDVAEQVVATAAAAADNAPVIVRRTMPPVTEADVGALGGELSLLTGDDPVERLEREIGPTVLRLQTLIRGAVLRSKIRWARNQLRDLQARAKGALSRAIVVPRLVKERLAERREEARQSYRRQQAEVRQELERRQAEARRELERQEFERQQAERMQVEARLELERQEAARQQALDRHLEELERQQAAVRQELERREFERQQAEARQQAEMRQELERQEIERQQAEGRQQAEARQVIERQQAELKKAELQQELERQQAARKQAEFKYDSAYIPPTPQRPQTQTAFALAQQSGGSIFNLQSLNILSGGQSQTATRTPEETLPDANSTAKDVLMAGATQGVSTETATQSGVVDKGKGKATDDGPGAVVAGETGPKLSAGKVFPISTRQKVKNERSFAKIGDTKPITRGRTSAAFGGHWGADTSGMPGSSKTANFDFAKMAENHELDANIRQTAVDQVAKEGKAKAERQGPRLQRRDVYGKLVVDGVVRFDLAQMNKNLREYADATAEAAEQVAQVEAEEAATPEESHEAEESEISEEE